jgi:hypothetical protein
VGHRDRRSAGRLLVVVTTCAAVSACGPVGGDGDVVPIEEGADAVEADAEDGTGGGDGQPPADDGGTSDDGTGQGQLVIGAPFRVPSPSELSLDGDELTRRIVDACEAAQPAPPPPGPCVEVVIVPRPDPEREPGWWIGTDPAGGQEVAHGTTVTLFVADETSPTQGFGTDDAAPPEELGTDGNGSEGSGPDEPPADVEQVDGGDADGGA